MILMASFEERDQGIKLAREAISHCNKILQYLYELETMNNHLEKGWGLTMAKFDSIVPEMARRKERSIEIRAVLMERLVFREKNYPIDD